MTDTTNLLVPMELSALLVNQQVKNGTQFTCWQNNYKLLTQYMQSPTPAPFQAGGHTPDQGVHLHWKLPAALTHGQSGNVLFVVINDVVNIVNALEKNTLTPSLTQAFTSNNLTLSAKVVSVNPVKEEDNNGWQLTDWESGQEYFVSVKVNDQAQECLSVSNAKIDFPVVPNRWLVMRFQPGMTKVEPKSWIIVSDYMNATDGRVSYLVPKSQNLSSVDVCTRIGKCEVLSANWKETDASGAMFLKAVGPGDVTFASYASSVENVFSFVDTDVTALPENTPLSYMVVGWYANPQFDPLYNPLQQVASAEFLARMDKLRWQIAGVSKMENYKGPVATKSYYHAMVNSLTWQTAAMPSGQVSNVPEDIANTVKVAIGNTSVEALSALIKATAGEEDVDLTLLEAFQYGVLDSLDKVGGKTLVADKMRQARYGARSGGILWNIVASQQSGGGDDTPTPDLTPYLDKLACLNQLQRSVDDTKRALASLQWTLYARWWKNKNYNSLGQGPTNPPDNMDTIADELLETSTQYKDLVTKIQSLQKEISDAYSNGSLPLFTDQAATLQYATSVLNLPDSLTLKSTNMPRYWHPNEPVMLVSGIQNSVNEKSNAVLTCRTASQVVTGLSIDGTVVTASQASSIMPLPVQNSDIANIVYALCQEAWFLDPGNAANIAKNLFSGKLQASTIATAISEGDWACADSFAPADISLLAWKQPWKPLFLEWSVKWFPTYAQKDANSPWVFQRDQWKFNGNHYEWTGTSLDESISFGYTGRTILSSNTVLNFENRLKDYIAKSKTPQPKLEKLDDLLVAIKEWGMLSQQLSGLHEQFATQSIGQAWPPIGEVASLIQSHYQTSPDPSKGDKDYDYGPVSPSFFPQMGGFFVIDNIQIVDSFGQTISLLAANKNPTGGKASAFTPIRSQQLTSANHNISVGDYTPAQFIQQPLGLVQAAQLKMRWVGADNDGHEVGLYGDANPVCGWVLPNHLDNSLSIYDQAGLLLGEIREDLNSDACTWYPAPDSASPITDPKNISNQHLSNVVCGLLAADKQFNTAMDNFTKVIDETLWMVDPLGGRGDKNMSVLVGRPLAVLRIGLGLELEGDPLYNQSWADTFTNNDNGVTATPFDVRLGSLAIRDDGLMGYYADNQYQIFNSVHYPQGLDQNSDYVKAIGGKEGNYLSLKPNAPQTYITLLMDPRGSLHASTGILPVKEIVLPERFVDAALKNMEVTFRVGSLLTATTTIQIPRLSEQNGQWSWINHTSPTEFTSEAIQFSSPNAKLSAATVEIKDGWLKLIANQKGG